MSKKTYGYARGPITGDYYEVANADEQYFIAGGSAVKLDSDGKVELCIDSDDDIWGFALAPQSVAAGSSVTTYYNTVSGDKLYVLTSNDAVVSMPSDQNFTQNMISKRCDVTNGNKTTIQTVDTSDSTSGILQIVGGIVGEKVVFVKMHDGVRSTESS